MSVGDRNCGMDATLPERTQLEAWAKGHGLEFFGIVELGREEAFSRYEAWLEDEYHAGMEYMKRNRDKRENPDRLLPGGRSALIFGQPYNIGDTWSPERPAEGRVAMYARFPDYHRQLKRRLEFIISELKAVSPDLRFRPAVDTLPLLERALAARTEFGFIGKNTLYIHPQKGSLFLLGEILTDGEWEPDEKEPVVTTRRSKRTGGCGSCRKCQVACPTGALDEAYRLDARKCLSYWTIEHRGLIPEEFWSGVGQYMFGCDICQLVCPYNEEIPRVPPELVRLKDELDLFEVATMDHEAYVRLFVGTPMTRAKREGLQRNALIAMFALGDGRLGEAISLLATSRNAVIRGTLQQIRDQRKTPV